MGLVTDLLCIIVKFVRRFSLQNIPNFLLFSTFNALGDCAMILAVYRTMSENASKITLNATYRKESTKSGLPRFGLRYFDVPGVPRDSFKD